MKKIKSPFLTTHFSESGKSAKKRIGSILNTRQKKIGAAAICLVLLCAASAGGMFAVKKMETEVKPEAAIYFENINIDELYQTKTPYVGNHIADGKVMGALEIYESYGAATTALQTTTEPYGIKLVFKDPINKVPMETEACAMLALIDNLGYVEWEYTNGEENILESFSAENASQKLGADVKSFGESKERLLELFMISSGSHEDMEYLENLDVAPQEAVMIENGKMAQEGRFPEFADKKCHRLVVIDKNGDEEKRTIINYKDGIYSGAYYRVNRSSQRKEYGSIGEWGNIVSQNYDGRTQCLLLPVNPLMSNAYTVFEIGQFSAENIEEAIGNAVLKQNEDMYVHWEFSAEGHVILDSEKTGNNREIVYAVVSYGEYAFMNDMFIKDGGSGAIPVVMEFSQENGKYVLEDYKGPEDGSYYTDSIKEMFPLRLQRKALNAGEYYDELLSQQYSQAQEYLKRIGRAAKVGSYRDLNAQLPEMNVEASNKLVDVEKYGRFQYPIYIGTVETVVDGVRYISERKWDGDEKGGTAEFITTAENGGVVEYFKYKVDGENVELIEAKTSPQEIKQ